ncbi:hypothetical protein HOK00_01245 [bacterium]|jgi:hypothetical protein|nr:hypothetical protein [bacterium]
MINKLKSLIKKTFLYAFIIKYRQTKGLKEIEKEISKNKYYPHYIHAEIIELSKKYKINNFVETGTYIGNTIFGVKDAFKTIYSIELNNQIFNLVKERFKEYDDINILNGDSAKILHDILIKINKPTIFWLDAHYSSGGTSKGERHTPIFEELKTIFNHVNKNHIILIDDMKDFIGQNDYPTIKELESFVIENSNYEFSITNGVAYLIEGSIND